MRVLYMRLIVLTALLFIVSLYVTYSVLLLEDSSVSPSFARLPKLDQALQPDAGKQEGDTRAIWQIRKCLVHIAFLLLLSS
jgi:hypothetical protein